MQHSPADDEQLVLPLTIRVILDPLSTSFDAAETSAPHGVERECDESNTELSKNGDAGARVADLRIEIAAVSDGCPVRTDTGIARNDGTVGVGPVELLFSAKDPSLEGEPLVTDVTDDHE